MGRLLTGRGLPLAVNLGQVVAQPIVESAGMIGIKGNPQRLGVLPQLGQRRAIGGLQGHVLRLGAGRGPRGGGGRAHHSIKARVGIIPDGGTGQIAINGREQSCSKRATVVR